MGRQPKYFSLDERKAGKRATDRRYIHSTHGKTVRSAYQQSSHRRKQRARRATTPPPDTPDTLPLPPLSPSILESSRRPLPTDARLFAEALRSEDALDESDLGRWKREPPFEEDDDPTDPHSDSYLRFTKSLEEVLHGVRLRDQNQRDATLREGFMREGQDRMVVKLRDEVLGMLESWERVQKLKSEGFYHIYHQSREYAMLEHYIHWLGRSICHLYHLKFLVH
ncbi:hypothetical protein R3P38DRAFT_2805772 [Favolaschia claudopus]|uniref:Uncharacterized protein n=1 Tax=Favolaschia claudopus TaxID=2862362 RepID=A0AAV9ZMB3_9AGAR